MTEPRLAEMHMHIDQTGRDDQSASVDLFNFGFRTSNFGFGAKNFSAGDVEIADFIPLIGRVDHAAVANNRGAHVWGAHACSVLFAASCGDELLSDFAVMSDCCPDVRVRDRKMRSPALGMSALHNRTLARL